MSVSVWRCSNSVTQTDATTSELTLLQWSTKQVCHCIGRYTTASLTQHSHENVHCTTCIKSTRTRKAHMHFLGKTSYTQPTRPAQADRLLGPTPGKCCGGKSGTCVNYQHPTTSLFTPACKLQPSTQTVKRCTAWCYAMLNLPCQHAPSHKLVVPEVLAAPDGELNVLLVPNICRCDAAAQQEHAGRPCATSSWDSCTHTALQRALVLHSSSTAS